MPWAVESGDRPNTPGTDGGTGAALASSNWMVALAMLALLASASQSLRVMLNGIAVVV